VLSSADFSMSAGPVVGDIVDNVGELGVKLKNAGGLMFVDVCANPSKSSLTCKPN